MLSKNAVYVILLFVVATSCYIFYRFSYKKTEVVESTKIYGFKYPLNLNFAGEDLPLNDSLIIKYFYSALQENTYLKLNTRKLQNQHQKNLKTIEKILDEYNVADDFKYVPILESNFIDTITSKAGAVGYWQIMIPMATTFNLIVNDSIDERTDLKKSTEAICKYLLLSHEKFNSWTKALASLNYGIDGLQNIIEKPTDSSVVINVETNDYIFKLMVLKEVFLNPTYFGRK